MKQVLLALLCHSLILGVWARGDGVSIVVVRVTPSRLSPRVGGSAEFVCSADLSQLADPANTHVTSVAWFRPDNKPLPSGRYAIHPATEEDASLEERMINSTLTMWQLSFVDQGHYVCQVTVSTSEQNSAPGLLNVGDIRGPDRPIEPQPVTNAPDTGNTPAPVPDAVTPRAQTTAPSPTAFVPGTVPVGDPDTVVGPDTPDIVTRERPTARPGPPGPDFAGPIPTRRSPFPVEPGDIGIGNPGQAPSDVPGGGQPPRPSPCERSPCENGGTCADRVDGSFTCSCFQGWTGSDCGEDVDECATGVDECPQRNSECINTPGSHICQCDPGFELRDGVCIDVNECALDNTDCSVLSVCSNVPGSYICECPSGFTGDGRNCNPYLCSPLDDPSNGQVMLSDGLNIGSQADYTCNLGYETFDLTLRVCFSSGSWTGEEPRCNDIDECARGTHSCSVDADCMNTPGSYRCICRLGYTGDGSVCTPITCPALGSPENGEVIVTGNLYRDQAVFQCDRGYRLNGLELLACLVNGSWSSAPPTCDDIDECDEGTHNCSPDGYCVNVPGSFQCVCRDEYTGDGIICTRIQCAELPDPANGKVVISPVTRVSGSVAMYTCRPGYVIQGTDVQVCGQDGVWFEEAPHCIDKDECALGTHNCDVNAQCINTNGSYTCACLPGYYGDGLQCRMITCPQLQPLPNGRIRLSDGQRFQSVATHSCTIGYQLAGQRRRMCLNTSSWSGDTPRCNDVDECVDNPCSPHASCINEPGSFRCVCWDGYRGDGFVCNDIDECLLGLHNCDRHAECLNSPGAFDCECEDGYSGSGVVCVSKECGDLEDPAFGSVRIFGSGVGAVAIYFCQPGFTVFGRRLRYCEDGGQWSGQAPMCNDTDECVNARCHPLAECRNVPGTYQCVCPPGYTGDGRRCTPIDPCAVDLHNCDPNAACDATSGTAVCTCVSGYAGTGQACFDVNECLDPGALTNCDKVALCNNLVASFECVCPPGFTGDGIVCTALDPCYNVQCGVRALCVGIEPAAGGGGGGDPVAASTATAECLCEPGYFGDPSVMCIYVDPCDSQPCVGGGAVCAGSIQGYNCTCLQGYEHINPNECRDIPECVKEVSPCSEHAFCTDQPGSYTCTCEPGFIGDGVICEDVSECLDGVPCGNNFVCTNTVGSFKCDCPDGFFLDGDECVAIVAGKCVKNGHELDITESRDFPLTETRRTSPPAADIVFVIDESASMVTEHQWLTRLSDQLNQALNEQGIGIAMPNHFGLVGFAKNSPEHITGRIIRMLSGRLFGSALELSDATVELALDGHNEDLYYGILTALDKYPFRPGMACQIVGVTDEGRTPLPPPQNSTMTSSPTFNSVLRMLQDRKCALNVVVNQRMQAGDATALGVGSSRDGFIEMGNGEFKVQRHVGQPVVDSAHGTTHRDYTLLAFATGGGAWDLNKLRVGGATADAFTKAFVWLKEREITRQLCERCTCLEGRPMPLCQRGCFGEPPFEVTVTGGGEPIPELPKDIVNAVNSGGVAEFRCYAEGDPAPYFTWVLEDGDALPTAHDILGEQGSILRLRDVTKRTCVRCIAINSQGNSSAVQCVNVAQSCVSQSGDGEHVLHGSSERNYSTIRGDDIVNLPGSALVVFVVDESGSMAGEHKWLKTTANTLEQNLIQRDVRGNQYALVGFASPYPTRSDALGRIVAVGRNDEHCGTAQEMSAALARLKVDGRREDGFSAMGMALTQLSCMKQRMVASAAGGLVTACQIILITDEDRDVMTDWTYARVLDDLSRQDCILNVVVQGRFRGRDDLGRYVRALGLDRHGRAVVATPDLRDFTFLDQGEYVKDTGFGTTKEDYISMANRAGGGSWDLTMLRTEQYRESFTKGFIAAKVEEIQLQIFGTCKECLCQNGTLLCRLLPGVSTSTRCVSPPSSTQLRVQFGDGNAVVGEGDLLRLKCNATNAQGDKVTVIFKPHPLAAVQVGNELLFRNISKSDTGRYTCQARTAEGQTEAFFDLNVENKAPAVTRAPGIGGNRPGTAAPGGGGMPTPGPDGFQIGVPTSDVAVHASVTSLALGDALVLTCCVGQRAYPVLDWYFLDANGYELPLPSTSVISDKGQLVIVQLATEHSGRYQCVHRSIAGAESGETVIRVRGSAVSVSPTSTTCVV